MEESSVDRKEIERSMIKFFRIFTHSVLATKRKNLGDRIGRIYGRPGTQLCVQGVRADDAYLSPLHRRFARVRVKSATLPASIAAPRDIISDLSRPYAPATLSKG